MDLTRLTLIRRSRNPQPKHPKNQEGEHQEYSGKHHCVSFDLAGSFQVCPTTIENELDYMIK